MAIPSELFASVQCNTLLPVFSKALVANVVEYVWNVSALHHASSYALEQRHVIVGYLEVTERE